MKISLVSLASLTLTLAITATSLTGCSGDDGVNGKDGIDGTDGVNGKNGIDGKDGQDISSTPPAPMPPSTIPAVGWMQLCLQEHYARQEGLHTKLDICFDKGGTDCVTDYNTELEESSKAFNICRRELPMVSKECRDQFDPSSTHDSDGDGVSDADEFWMMTNPCEPCSFGGNCQSCGGGGTDSSDCDANQDWDDDGTPNAKDIAPRCPSNGGPLGSNCILQSRAPASFFPTPTPSRLLNHDPPAGESGTAWMTTPHLSIARVAFRIFRLLLTCIQPLCKNLAMNTSRQNLIIVNLFITLQREKS